MPSSSKMLMADMRHTSSAKASDVAAAKTATKATDVTSSKAAAHVSAAEAATHVTATKAATHMSAAATTAACLCTCG